MRTLGIVLGLAVLAGCHRIPTDTPYHADAGTPTVSDADGTAHAPAADVDHDDDVERGVLPAPDKYAFRVAELEHRLRGRGFSVRVEEPFVVVGDGGHDFVERVATGTVRFAVERLRSAYFSRDPLELVDIWLFKDEASYKKHALELFGDEPTTPFGYYSSRHRALVMNISTGTGTLVHEIVHPFIEANFPSCPAWFNEGLASLYEQCSDRNGRIWGLPNWRLRGLKEGLRSGDVVSFRTLTSTTTDEFYGESRGLYYAQARYLCYYLQEKGLLESYYRSFVAAADQDPTGYTTLVEVLGKPDMGEFQKEWERFVTNLRFPG